MHLSLYSSEFRIEVFLGWDTLAKQLLTSPKNPELVSGATNRLETIGGDSRPKAMFFAALTSAWSVCPHDRQRNWIENGDCVYTKPENTADGMARIDQDNGYTHSTRFVFDERSQLGESPIAVSCSLVCASSPGPRANARQIFQGNRTLRALRGLHETLADLMINILLKTPLASRQFSQVSFRRQRSARLQVRSQGLHPLAMVFDQFAGHDRTVARRGDVGYAQIDAQCAFHVSFVGVGDVAGRGKKDAVEVQCRLALPVLSKSRWRSPRQTIVGHRPDGHVLFVCQDRMVIGNTSEGRKGCVLLRR
jgi:hypothetical protein